MPVGWRGEIWNISVGSLSHPKSWCEGLYKFWENKNKELDNEIGGYQKKKEEKLNNKSENLHCERLQLAWETEPDQGISEFGME